LKLKENNMSQTTAGGFIPLTINDNGALLVQQDGNRTFKNRLVRVSGTPQSIIYQSGTTETCIGVWVGAPASTSGAAVNTETIYVGDSIEQNIPVCPTDYKGFFLRVGDAAEVYATGASGEVLNYAIYS
jgi:hypothetical protein